MEDHDSPWKEVLELFFQPFLQLLYPDIHEAIDWSESCTFLDKELQKLAPDGLTGRRHADKLVQVGFRNGDQRWLLIHVEVQGRRDASFPERMFVYYHRIREHHRRKVVSLAVLADTHSRYRPDRFEEWVMGSGVSFRFRVVKLLDFQDRKEELLASDNPFALLVAAQLTAKLEKDGKRKADNLIGFYRLASRKKLDRALIARLLVFLEWLVALPPEIKDGYYAEQIDRMKEESTMPYVSFLEQHLEKRMKERVVQQVEEEVRARIHQESREEGREVGRQEGRQEGLHEGRQEGLHEGRATLLLHQFQLKFGDLPESVRQRVAHADQTELSLWAARILFADSIEAVLADSSETGR